MPTLCPNCKMPLKEASGPETVEDVKAMIDNQLHMDGLCPDFVERAVEAGKKLGLGDPWKT